MVLSSDVSTSAGLDRFRKLNPNQYVEVGISEQSTIGMATGLAAKTLMLLQLHLLHLKLFDVASKLKLTWLYET